MSEPQTEAPCWNANAEKLHCLIVLDDDIASKLSARPGPAFFRAFIVEDRATGQMRMKFRFQYINPDERNWYLVTTKLRGVEAIEFFQQGIEVMQRTAALAMGHQLPKDAISSFYPPDDGGDATATIIWLEMNDLIEIREVKEGE